MRDLLRDLSETHDLVIIDSPPVMAVSDAIILSRAADTTLMLVRWGATPRGIVVSAVRQLQKAGAKTAGAVLSRVNMTKYTQYGYGSHGYYYRRYKSYYST
jgi:succinoglycan biosynthesis transport protein ExoP